MVKQILRGAVPLLTITVLFSQSDPVAATGQYSKVYKGKEAAFEKAVAGHVKNGMALTSGLHSHLLS